MAKTIEVQAQLIKHLEAQVESLKASQTPIALFGGGPMGTDIAYHPGMVPVPAPPSPFIDPPSIVTCITCPNGVTSAAQLMEQIYKDAK